MNQLHILVANTNPPRASQMPRSCQGQVLDHDACQHNQLGLDGA